MRHVTCVTCYCNSPLGVTNFQLPYSRSTKTENMSHAERRIPSGAWRVCLQVARGVRGTHHAQHSHYAHGSLTTHTTCHSQSKAPCATCKRPCSALRRVPVAPCVACLWRAWRGVRGVACTALYIFKQATLKRFQGLGIRTTTITHHPISKFENEGFGKV